ncbi:MAG: hypothetical protein M5R42_02575 [Rhodocyclaceae bacterium]|nr:hypothetical protein [Rhodocyclaceae bacterium]
MSARITAQQSQLSRLLTRQYYAGETDAMRHLLSGNDPNQVARDAHFLSLLSRAKADLIRELGNTLTEKKTPRRPGAREKRGTGGNRESQQRERAGLIEQKKKRQTVLARLSDRIKDTAPRSKQAQAGRETPGYPDRRAWPHRCQARQDATHPGSDLAQRAHPGRLIA